jgi:arylsulfatase A
MAPARQPNVILIVADDLGYGDIGCFNEGRVRTPNLDRLVAEGVTCRQHYAASPICAPSRAALLTGRYNHRTGAITQHEIHGLDRIALREVTLADRFKNAGYATGLVGKWHNGTFDRRFEPNARGFDEFLGFCGGWIDYFDYTLRVNDGTRRSDGSYMTDVLTEEALGFVDRHKGAPFFLHLAYSAPHSPFQAPAGMAEPHLEKGLNRIVATTYAMIERMDEGIGRLLDKLDADGLTEQTIVLFTSDNGPAFFNPPYMLEPGEDTFNERFNAGLRGSKGWIYEGGIRVPMILRYPERVPAGTTNDDLIQFIDWVPTLMHMVGLPEIDAPPLDGSDVSAALMGEPANLPDQQFWQWNFYMPCIGTNAAMREGSWKLVRPMMKGTRFFSPELYATPEDAELSKAFVAADIAHKKDPLSIQELVPVPQLRLPEPEPLELYDLSADPGEQHDLAAQHPDRVAAMQAKLEDWFDRVEADRRTLTDVPL